MRTTTLTCPQCKAPLEYDPDNPILECPRCGCKQLIQETDEVAKERIRAKTLKDVELGKQQLKNEEKREEYQFELEKKNIATKWIKVGIAAIVAGLIIFGSFKFFDRIRHIGDVRVPADSESYLNRDYQDAKGLLEDIGFSNIECIVIKDLQKAQISKDGKTTQISINGKTEFKSKDWFPKNSLIKITYHILDPERKDDIKVPLSSDDLKGKKYQDVISLFKSVGFENIDTIVIEDLTKELENQDGIVTDISVNEISIFDSELWVNMNSEVVITYHKMDPNRIDDVAIPDSSSNLVGRNYLSVNNAFSTAGFTNIVFIPNFDSSLFSNKENQVEQVLINKITEFNAGEFVPYNSEVEIKYYAEKIKYENKELDKIISTIKNYGFTNVILNPLEDLNDDEIKKKENLIQNITIGGIEFSDANRYKLDTEIVINYHSKTILKEGRIEISKSSKDLKKEKYNIAISDLKKMGFTNITMNPLNDLNDGPFGELLHKNGDIQSVTINGKDKFEKGYIFDKNVEIIVTYHTFKKQ